MTLTRITLRRKYNIIFRPQNEGKITYGVYNLIRLKFQKRCD